MSVRRLAAILGLAFLAPTASAADPFKLEKGDHICIIGNALAERMQHDGWLEAYLHARFPHHNLTIRNLGFSGDEVAGYTGKPDFHKRLRSHDFGTADQWLSGNAPIPNPGAVADKSIVKANRFEKVGTNADVIFAKLDAKTFTSSTEVLKHIIDPSLKIDDKYASYSLLLTNDKTVTGMIVEEKNGVVKLIENPVASAKPLEIKVDDIATRKKAMTSIMPKGLVDKLTKDEQVAIRAAAKASVAYYVRLWEAKEVEARAAIVKSGAKIIPAAEIDRKSFVAVEKPVWDKFASTPELKALVQEVVNAK